MNGRPEVHILANREAVSAALAAHVTHLAAMASAARNRFLVAISGGSLMDMLGPELRATPLRERVDWSTWHVFWADERWVPWSRDESNYGRAKRLLFNHVGVPSAQIHAADVSLDPCGTAQAYESALAAVFQPGTARVPRFDLVLLGLGPDGHTASLFPNHPALSETRRWVVPVTDAPKPPPVRITMTLPVINNARHVVLVATGSEKANIVSTVLHSKVPQPELPVQRVHPSNGELQWFLDRAAAPSREKR